MKKVKEKYQLTINHEDTPCAIYEAETDDGKKIKITSYGSAIDEQKIKKQAEKYLK